MTEKEKNIIDTIRASKDITKEQLKVLLETEDTQTEEYLRKTAQETARRYPAQQPKSGPLPADEGRNPGLLQSRIRTGVSDLCAAGR